MDVYINLSLTQNLLFNIFGACSYHLTWSNCATQPFVLKPKDKIKKTGKLTTLLHSWSPVDHDSPLGTFISVGSQGGAKTPREIPPTLANVVPTGLVVGSHIDKSVTC
jgi:hypothetical protein